MPSIQHEAPLLLIRERPDLAPRLARLALGVELPAFREARIVAGDLTELTPAERRADLVVSLLDAKDEVVAGLIVEVQRTPDPEKHFAWPLYLASLHARLRCPVHLLVLAETDAVAEWARTPIPTLHPTSRFAPLVIGPREMPVITSIDEATREPQLAVLSAIVHGRRDVIEAALKGLLRLDDLRLQDYFDIIAATGGDVARTLMEAMAMPLGSTEYHSDWARNIFGEGKALGKAEGKAEAILAVLTSRGVGLSAAGQARIGGCRDLELLDRWLRRALGATSESDLFGNGS